MKKMEKAMYVIRMMAAAIEDAKVKFSEIEEESVVFNDYDADEEDIIIPLMISSYNHNHRHLVSNWLYNAYDGGASTAMVSSRLESCCDKFLIDVPHFTWGQENLISKIRYVQILEREEMEHLDAPVPYILCKERGYEYDLFGKKVYPIEKAWVYWKKEGEN